MRFELTADVGLSGSSTLEFPPFGSAEMDTHKGPLRLRARVVSTNAQQLYDLIEQGRFEQSFTDGKAEFWQALARLGIRTSAAAVLGAGIVTVLVFRRPNRVATALALTLTSVLLVSGSVMATLRPQALQEPRLTGFAANLPSVIGDTRTLTEEGALDDDDLHTLLRAVLELNSHADTMLPYQDSHPLTRVLFVNGSMSDPYADALSALVADIYGADFVVDASGAVLQGDKPDAAQLTDYRPIRWESVNGVTDGDGPAIAAHSAALTVHGLGIGRCGTSPRQDPALTVSAYQHQSGRAVAIALVPDDATAERLAGHVPLILRGAAATQSARELGHGSTYLTLGSTGLPAGESDTHPGPFQLTVLYLRGTALRAYDAIDLTGSGAEIVHRVVL
ncbi:MULTISPECIES: hypothetical protein [Micromonospora]|uniref:Uncharacterized protein n=1 Tax=Micromonospora solifontis TaxID=2487138 RepID=A0ABX9WET5_9ACTN|nr:MULTISPECIES: hypothetical protein [Micromonospora]NES16507.1 hypothetical protein [Micromonospora sp. PPF5-17B]NES37433.1 hypothetical protein [Micromonospora solifontis]NES58209.1 hypothetical protein [Micromonospora sp. PPF5-6]RNL98345.1 hypothetical protein EFE23_14880 [Micromonospora solifontis]